MAKQNKQGSTKKLRAMCRCKRPTPKDHKDRDLKPKLKSKEVGIECGDYRDGE